MEPLAPGTEDDPPIMYSTLNKQANEKERLLKVKAILKNGQYDHVFELSYVNGAEHWFCNACQCPVMGRVYQHEIGKRHTLNLSLNSRHAEKLPKDDSPNEQAPIALEIAPGEPVPPGFEGEIGRVAQIQERLDGFKVGPLIALEYLLELQDYDPSKEPVYLCILTSRSTSPRAIAPLAPYTTKQYKRNWQTTLQKIAEAVEKKFGRLKPYPIERDKFEKDRTHYSQLISKGRHFSETSGWTFEELIVHDELTKAYVEEDKQSYEMTPSANWGTQTFIQKPFKKRSPSPPVVAMPGKRSKANPRKQKPAYLEGKDAKGVAAGGGGTAGGGAAPSQSSVGRRRSSLSSVSSISSSDLSGNEQEKGKGGRLRTPPHQRGRQQFYERRRSPSPARRSPTARSTATSAACRGRTPTTSGRRTSSPRRR
ncbi:hypothetical protein NQ318_022361 [Aromia moschata]|uniref:Matrin-type domain-containing protein n=1 Tax=Aromia moschata TaxID=1265417 RepID=A0AAV8Z4J7_9CUCU|nr:hypothetical protein NQ318_022361 [Aromia moschata]